MTLFLGLSTMEVDMKNFFTIGCWYLETFAHLIVENQSELDRCIIVLQLLNSDAPILLKLILFGLEAVEVERGSLPALILRD